MIKTINLPISTTYQCKPIFLDQYNRVTQTSASIVFSSSNESCSIVDASSGIVTGIANGTCTITATTGELTSTMSVNVYTPVPSNLILS